MTKLLERLTTWIGDRYESEKWGLASPHASVTEELDYLLGNPFEHVQLLRRAECYVATVVLDLASVFRLKAEYELGRNDFLAVGALPTLLQAPDSGQQYLVNGTSISCEVNVPYEDEWRPSDGWKLAPHHKVIGLPYLTSIGRNWDQLAITSVVRDRHLIVSWVAEISHQ